MDYEGLPGIPEIWQDFIAGLALAGHWQPAAPSIDSLRAQAEALKNCNYPREKMARFLAQVTDPHLTYVQESIDSLRRPDTVVVLVQIRASLFGGPAFQLLKCLTAIKLCRHLLAESIRAVPCCGIEEVSVESPVRLSLLDCKGEIHELKLAPEYAGLRGADLLPEAQIEQLLGKIEELGGGTFDSEVMEILRSAYRSGETLASATAQLFTALMHQWGLVVFNTLSPDFRDFLDQAAGDFKARLGERKLQHQEYDRSRSGSLFAGQLPDAWDKALLEHSFVLPVAAVVISPCQLISFLSALPRFEMLSLPSPVPWPQPSVTILDRASERIVGKYRLSIGELYSGESKLTEQLKLRLPYSVVDRLHELESETGRMMAQLEALLPAEGEILAAQESCREKIIYQIEKLRQRCQAALEVRNEAIDRRIHKLCNLVAPNRRIQEAGLSGIYFLLRYSRFFLQPLYEKLQVMKFEHQLVSMG